MEWGISGYEIIINNLGCREDKKKLVRTLQDGLKNEVNNLCEDCRQRFNNNVLRILDCKNQTCQDVIKTLNIHDGHLCDDCAAHFEFVKTELKSLKISYQLDPYLVRGLDYYTRTVFEIRHKDLGSQDALGAGGRYDNLVKDLAGPDIGAMGFAFGVERLLLVAPKKPVAARRSLVYVIGLGQKAESESLKLLENIRDAGIPASTCLESKSLKGAMRQADDLQARFVLIIGEDELKKNVVTSKDMVSGVQKEVSYQDLIKELKNAQD
jgi:histidyl-tRNA synthetase